MKLLVLTSRFPYPLEKGDKLRLYHQLVELAEYHEIILVALSDEKVGESDWAEVKKICGEVYVFHRSRWMILKNLMLAIFTGMPFQVAFFYDRGVKKRIRELIGQTQPTHIYCQLIRTAALVGDVPVPKTLDYMDNFSAWTRKLASHQRWPWSKWFLEMEARRVEAFEKKVFSCFDHHTIISEQDRDRFSFDEKKKIQCIPNGVDVAFFQPRQGTGKKYDLAFIGNLGYYNNVEAARFLVQEVMPLVWSRHPECRVLLAGARPDPSLKKLAEGNVHLAGWVDDIRDAYAVAAIFVAPIFLGVGQQNKILEAMAMGIPCVTTEQVNRAIGARPGQEILVAGSTEDFASQIILLKENAQLQQKISEQGLSFVRKNFSWKTAVYELHQLISKNDFK